MRKTIARPLAAAAVTALTTATLGLGASPASAGGNHRGDDGGRDVTIPLTKQVSSQLRAGNNGVVATGAASKDVHRGRIVLTFPVRGGSDDRKNDRRGDHGHGKPWRLAGGIAFVGAGPDVTWKKLRVRGDKGVVSALVDGDRRTVLRFAKHTKQHGHHRTGGHGGAWLKLTTAGAASLNRAAQGSPFEAGDAFAGGKYCR